MSERRDALRIPDSRLITEIVSENPSASSIINLSSTGIYAVKPREHGPLGPRMVQLEIPVPEASETIWAMGEVVFDKVASKTMGSGIRFKAMADRDWGFVRDIVESRRQWVLEQMMQEIRWRKELAAHPSPFTAPPPPVKDNTVKMFLTSEVVI